MRARLATFGRAGSGRANRALSPEEKALHDAIKAKAAELEELLDRAWDLRFPVLTAEQLKPTDDVKIAIQGEALIGLTDPAGEYFRDGMKSLELAVMWTVKGLTA